MTEIRNGYTITSPAMPQLVSKSVSTVANAQTNIFRYTGSIAILSLTGRVTTPIQNQATNIKFQILSDALAAYDICAVKNMQAFGAGSLYSITGTAANGAVSTTLVGAIAPGQANPVVATCVTQGYITQNSDAASSGAITWELLWQSLSANASVSAV